MINMMTIDGYKARIQFDPEIGLFRGEFVGLNGGADFYAEDVAGLRKEGAKSLKAFLEVCEEQGIDPRKEFSGKFNVRVKTALHEAAVIAAAARNESLNQWIQDAIEHALSEAGDLAEAIQNRIKGGRPATKKAAAKKKPAVRKKAPVKKKAAARKAKPNARKQAAA